MLSFIDISIPDREQYFVMDDGVYYLWIVKYTDSAKEWLKNKNDYTFEIEHRNFISVFDRIVVYHKDVRLYTDEIREVTYI